MVVFVAVVVVVVGSCDMVIMMPVRCSSLGLVHLTWWNIKYSQVS